MSTYMANDQTIQRRWYLVNAEGKVLGRLASQIASRLRGKHKAEFTPHADTGDYVVVINVDKLAVTANKGLSKKYYRHSEYPGGLRTDTFASLQSNHPGRVLELAIKGMLPKGPLGRQMFRKLKVYAGTEHPHAAQMPEPTEFK
ncbi:MAG: 50S ribosomal protein L13 [Gammaproteobacteria bacterium RIFCSPHIGHO2_12_FULL_45_9]|nr:MAG: 50S ribosomal protein L13 [Gammaproteobacteria bacterium RIFCSPHIGHO2_12_FULL_45_9]